MSGWTSFRWTGSFTCAKRVSGTTQSPLRCKRRQPWSRPPKWGATRMRNIVCLAAIVALLGSASAEAGKKRTQTHFSGVVNLNDATAAQLDLLPGVSPKLAHDIVSIREKQR